MSKITSQPITTDLFRYNNQSAQYKTNKAGYVQREYNITLYIDFLDYHAAFDKLEIWTGIEALKNARIDLNIPI